MMILPEKHEKGWLSPEPASIASCGVCSDGYGVMQDQNQMRMLYDRRIFSPKWSEEQFASLYL
jgi:hypothetical protein